MHPVPAGAAAALLVAVHSVTWSIGLLGGHSSATMTQVNTSRALGPGACGPVDASYISVANETGGQPFFMSPSEVGKSAHIMLESSRSDAELMLWASGTAAGAPRRYDIPVDASIKRLTVSTTFDKTGGSVTLASPNGTAVQGSAQGHPVQETVLHCGRVITVDAPQAGVWRASVAPSGRFWLVARGRSDLALDSAEFVRRGGRPGHEGLFKIQGQPLAGQPAFLRARVSELEVRSRAFVLLSTEGRPIRSVALTSIDGTEFGGALPLPLEPFRVAVNGLDVGGAPYQRLFSWLFHAELVEVRPAGDRQTLAPGEDTAVTFSVRNVGPRARFRIVAADAHRFVTRVEPDVLDIEEGAERSVSVWLRAPIDAVEGTGVDLTITATSAGARASTNSAVQRLTVARR